MTANSFVDTNVLLYAISNDPAQVQRSGRANDLLRRPDLGISTQVLSEFYVNSTNPKKTFRLKHEEAVAAIEVWKQMVVQPVTVEVVVRALGIKGRYQISYWDALIIASARQLGCRTVFTEDLNHTQYYDGVQVLNPFDPTTRLDV